MVGELTDVHLQLIQHSGYVLEIAGEPAPGMIDRSEAINAIRRTEGSGEAVVAALSYGTLIHDDPRAEEPSYGSMVSNRPVWLVVVDNVRTPVLGRLSRTESLPTSYLESRWVAIDARTGESLISSSLLR